MADPSVTLQQLKDAGVDVLDLRPGRLLVLSCDTSLSPATTGDFLKAVTGLLQEHGINVPILVLPSSVTAQVVNLAKEDGA